MRTALALSILVVLLPAAASGASATSGTWRPLPPAPVVADFGSATSVWTGHELLVFGRDTRTALDPNGNPYSIGAVNVAAAYDVAARRWRPLAPPKGPSNSPGTAAVWTGKQMLVWGSFDYEAYDVASNRWRRLPPAPSARGIVVWTGKEMIGWGGGCCGDAFSSGSAYSLATNRWRLLPRSPLAGNQHPIGAWTGRELVLLVSGLDADGKPAPARLARAAAYDPGKNRWRRLAPPPAVRIGAAAVWDGREILMVGGAAPGGRPTKTAFAFDPGTNRWRNLAPMPSGRSGALTLWTGKSMLVVGGQGGRSPLAYDPRTNRWSVLPRPPLPARLEPTAAWTGRSLIVWGGVPTATWGQFRSAGAEFTPPRSGQH